MQRARYRRSMFVISLIAPAGHLDVNLAQALRNAWGGGDIVELAAGEAYEFSVSTRPENFDDVRKDVLDQGVDLNLISAENRRKSLLLADMDSTMIDQECIDELAAQAGIGDRVAAITARAMNGELDFEEALRERVGLLRDLPASTIEQVIADRITLAKGGRVLVQTMRANGARCALVSGGFTAFTAHVAEVLGFHEHRANQLDIANGTLTGEVIPPILGREAKITALNEITSEIGTNAGDVIAVGDGANDLGMLGLAGMGVALHAKPSVAAQCDLRVHHGDLTALLFLQGYCKDDFTV